MGNMHVAKTILARSHQSAAGAGPGARSRHQCGAARAGGGTSRAGGRSERHAAGARVHRDDRRRGSTRRPIPKRGSTRSFTISNGCAMSASRCRATESPLPAPADERDDTPSVPAWFVALVHPEKTSVSVPVSIREKPTALVITSIPNDEIAEIWDGIVTQLEVGSAVAVALFLITMMVVGRALAPLEALSQAMAQDRSRVLRRASRARRGAGARCDLHPVEPSCRRPWARRSRRRGGWPSAPSRCRISNARRSRANCMMNSGRISLRCARMSAP